MASQQLIPGQIFKTFFGKKHPNVDSLGKKNLGETTDSRDHKYSLGLGCVFFLSSFSAENSESRNANPQCQKRLQSLVDTTKPHEYSLKVTYYLKMGAGPQKETRIPTIHFWEMC